MDKEAQEKMAQETTRMIEAFLTAFRQDERRGIATQIYNAMFTLGYHKLPKDKPPLVENPWKRHIDVQQGFDGGSQAQRESDIKHYEGK